MGRKIGLCRPESTKNVVGPFAVDSFLPEATLLSLRPAVPRRGAPARRFRRAVDVLVSAQLRHHGNQFACAHQTVADSTAVSRAKMAWRV